MNARSGKLEIAHNMGERETAEKQALARRLVRSSFG
jgi:hypothetical protein